jgi:hypothetical protein
MAYDRIRSIGSSQIYGGLLLFCIGFCFFTAPLTVPKCVALAAATVAGLLAVWNGWRILRRAPPRPPEFYE